MGLATDRWTRIYLLGVLVVLYVPMAVIGLASVSRSRFFTFPVSRYDLKWYGEAFSSLQVREALLTSATIALCVGLASVVVAFFGALAYARFRWRGRGLYQQLLLIPIFFPQPVLGLALQLWFNTLGVPMSWTSTVLAQLVWIVPVVTLIVAIQAYGYDPAIEEAAYDLGATRWMVLRDITLPLLGPGVVSGFIFAVLLSWGNLPLAYFTSGADVTIPEWLYGRMIGGYTPMVPAIGFATAAIGGVVLLAGLAARNRLARTGA